MTDAEKATITRALNRPTKYWDGTPAQDQTEKPTQDQTEKPTKARNETPKARNETPKARNETPKAQGTGRPCLCGCGDTTGPKSNYRPGHDQRTKGYVTRALAWVAGDAAKRAKGTARLPQALVDRMTEDPAFLVHGHGATEILQTARETGTF